MYFYYYWHFSILNFFWTCDIMCFMIIHANKLDLTCSIALCYITCFCCVMYTVYQRSGYFCVHFDFAIVDNCGVSQCGQKHNRLYSIYNGNKCVPQALLSCLLCWSYFVKLKERITNQLRLISVLTYAGLCMKVKHYTQK